MSPVAEWQWVQAAPPAPRRTQQGGRYIAAGSVLISQREGGGGWTGMCVLAGSEGGPLDPVEYKEAKRAKKRLLLLAPASGQGD